MLVAICEFKLKWQSWNVKNWDKIYFNLCDLDLRPLTLTFCMVNTFVNGNYLWKFHDDMMRGTVLKVC